MIKSQVALIQLLKAHIVFTHFIFHFIFIGIDIYSQYA